MELFDAVNHPGKFWQGVEDMTLGDWDDRGFGIEPASARIDERDLLVGRKFLCLVQQDRDQIVVDVAHLVVKGCRRMNNRIMLQGLFDPVFRLGQIATDRGSSHGAMDACTRIRAGKGRYIMTFCRKCLNH